MDDRRTYDQSLKLVYSTFRSDELPQDLQRFLQSALPALWSEKTKCMERTLGQEYIRIEAKKIADEESLLLIYLSRKPVPPPISEGSITVHNSVDLLLEGFNRYYGFCGATENFSQTIEQFGKQQVPILLLGEQGTGKDAVAAYLYSIGPYCAHPLYTVDCQLISDKNLLVLLKNPNSPLNELQVTLYFKNILSLNPLRQDQLIQFLEALSLDKRRRILCSFSTQANAGQEIDRYLASICTRLHAVSFRLPALRERREDISSIATLFLSQLNMLLGKQLTGFEPQALEMLTAFDWPYNLDQFHSVLQELAGVTSSFYISAEDTAAILRRETAKYAKHTCTSINLNQSMEGIMYDVLCTVLQQEGNNQKRAAQRLGIARWCFWRMLRTKEESSSLTAP